MSELAINTVPPSLEKGMAPAGGLDAARYQENKAEQQAARAAQQATQADRVSISARAREMSQAEAPKTRVAGAGAGAPANPQPAFRTTA